MPIPHTEAALRLALRMTVRDAAHIVSLQQLPDLLLPPGAPLPPPVFVEAAGIVCGWVDTYGPRPRLH